MLIPFLLVLFTFGIALGIFGCGSVLRLGPSAEWFTWTMPAIVSPFVGVFYPVATLPPWMRLIGYMLPPSYVFEGMRAMLAGGAMPAGTLAMGAGLAVLDLLLACWFFARVHRHAVRSGLLARYSAESIG
jgi:ABC-2 type transport system permease protein